MDWKEIMEELARECFGHVPPEEDIFWTDCENLCDLREARDLWEECRKVEALALARHALDLPMVK